MKCIELFAGIGGFAQSIPSDWSIAAAVDIDRDASETYRYNMPHPYWVREIESLPRAWLEECDADLWWMSPPCTPFTRKGAMRDITDTRSKGLLHLIELVSTIRPRFVCIENVVGFEQSEAVNRIQSAWKSVGYEIQIQTVCPSQLGIPNRRPRVYLLASQSTCPEAFEPVYVAKRLDDYLDLSITRATHPELWIARELEQSYGRAMDTVQCGTPELELTSCFGASYGKSITRAGSYLITDEGCRRFHPSEILRLLGFFDGYRFPASLSLRRQWHLAGNSLALDVVRALLRHWFAAR